VNPCPDPFSERFFLEVARGDGFDRLDSFGNSTVVARWRFPKKPLRSMNSTVERKAARLFPSGSGWFFARRQHSTAAFVAKSG
jgi:hypothetical protein